MKLRSISKVRHLSRYREVANVFIKYGFVSAYQRLGINIPFKFAERGWADQPGSARRLRYAFEELGPTFIKMGQLLSTRADILGPEYIAELEHLQDDVPAFSMEDTRKTLALAGLDIETDFKYFRPEPLAAASIGQVYEACLLSGERVVVKVKRPGIDDIMKVDLEILREIASLAERHNDRVRFYKISEVIEELGEALINELDFEKEARNIEIFYNNFREVESVIIPRVYWPYCGKGVLTMEYVDGVKISDLAGLKQRNFDTARVAGNIVAALYHQIYKHGFFHADPHPGNMAVGPGEKIIFYDFGQVGVIDDYTRDKLVTLIIGMMRYDVTGVTRALLDIADKTQDINIEELRRDVAKLSRKYYGVPLSQINIGAAMAELLDLSVYYHARLPVELSLLVKMLMTVEHTVSQLDPKLSIVDIAEPYGKEALRQRFSREKVKREVGEVLLDYGDFIRTLPRDFSNTLKRLGEGQLNFKIEHYGLDKLITRLDLISNRIALSIILAGIIVGTSLFSNMSGKSVIARIPLPELSFSLAIMLGLFLAYSILRSGKY